MTSCVFLLLHEKAISSFLSFPVTKLAPRRSPMHEQFHLEALNAASPTIVMSVKVPMRHLIPGSTCGLVALRAAISTARPPAAGGTTRSGRAVWRAPHLFCQMPIARGMY